MPRHFEKVGSPSSSHSSEKDRGLRHEHERHIPGTFPYGEYHPMPHEKAHMIKEAKKEGEILRE